MQRLAKSKKLGWLVLDNTRVTGEGLKSLSGLRELNVLNLSNSPIGNDGLMAVGTMANLNLLYLSNLRITDEGIAYLSNLSNLETLTLECVNVSDAGIKRLETGPRLLRLNLTGTRIRGDALPSICNPTLEYLRLSDTPIGNEALRHLENATGLGELYFDGTYITDDGLAHLANIPSLDTLDLGRTKITGSGLRHLGALPNLNDLDLSDANLSRDGFEFLTKLLVPPPGGSSYLALHGTPLDDSTMDVIARLPVTQLFLSRTRITDAGLAKLINMPNPQNIDLTATAVTPAGVAALKQRIPSLVTVQTSFDRDPK
jgi:internalin A